MVAKILKQQQWHVLFLSILLTGIYFFIKKDPPLLKGTLFGIDTITWFLFAIAAPIVHQVFVFICWRSELYHQGISKIFGEKGFTLFKLGFAILIFLRLLTIVLLAFSSSGTLRLNTPMIYGLTLICLVPSAYLFYSVKKYFGMDRAFGLDHFKKDEIEPFVKRGIFKYTSNGMYTYGFLFLWIPGLLAQSKAALVAALFNHVYIWVHYYFTELPDIKVIYGERNQQL